jgi:hypothetical protein
VSIQIPDRPETDRYHARLPEIRRVVVVPPARPDDPGTALFGHPQSLIRRFGSPTLLMGEQIIESSVTAMSRPQSQDRFTPNSRRGVARWPGISQDDASGVSRLSVGGHLHHRDPSAPATNSGKIDLAAAKLRRCPSSATSGYARK